MKGVNRKIIIGSIFFLSMFLLSCKFETDVYYESEELTKRKTQEDRFLNSFDNTKICTRILTTISSEIVFLKFSKKNIFNDIVIQDLMIKQYQNLMTCTYSFIIFSISISANILYPRV